MSSAQVTASTQQHDDRVRLLALLCQREGMSPRKFHTFDAATLRVFDATSVEEFIDNLRRVIAHLAIKNPTLATVFTYAINIDGRLSGTLMRRLEVVQGNMGVASKTAHRYYQRSVEQAAILFGQFETLDDITVIEVQPPANQHNAHQCPNDKAVRQLKARVRELETLMRSLLDSKHVAPSTKKAIRQHVV